MNNNTGKYNRLFAQLCKKSGLADIEMGHLLNISRQTIWNHRLGRFELSPPKYIKYLQILLDYSQDKKTEQKNNLRSLATFILELKLEIKKRDKSIMELESSLEKAREGENPINVIEAL